MMRVLIVEEALQTGKGHWPSYLGGITDGLRSNGDTVDILMHREALPDLVTRLQGTPYLTKNCWLDPASQGSMGGIRHNLSFRRELSYWLENHQPYEWVCALTMRLQHLFAFALLSRSGTIPAQTRFLLLFVQGFGLYAGYGTPTAYPKTPSIFLARLCFHLLAPAVRAGRIVLATETQGMQDELQRLTGLPVTLFPHPVEGKAERGKLKTEIETREVKPESWNGSRQNETKDQDLAVRKLEQGLENQEPTTKNEERVITITCPGFARHEKGNDLLQEAAKRILASPDAGRFRFVVQWPEPFAMPDGSNLGPDPALALDSRVEFLNQNLDEHAYEELLARTDLVVLPYRRSSYHHRVSRVAIEAASQGIPLIYTAGTWTEEVAELAGCGVAFQEETPEALENALMSAVAHFDSMARTARGSAAKVAEYHSTERFRSLLLEKM